MSACLPAWEATKPSWRAALTAWEVALSPGGWEPACLPAWEELNLWIPQLYYLPFLACYWTYLTVFVWPYWNLFSMKPWHSVNLCVDKIDAIFDLHNFVCLLTLSSILFIALTLAWSRFLSAFLIIFLALSVFRLVLAWCWLELNLYVYILKWRSYDFCSQKPSAQVFPNLWTSTSPLTHTLVV